MGRVRPVDAVPVYGSGGAAAAAIGTLVSTFPFCALACTPLPPPAATLPPSPCRGLVVVVVVVFGVHFQLVFIPHLRAALGLSTVSSVDGEAIGEE